MGNKHGNKQAGNNATTPAPTPAPTATATPEVKATLYAKRYATLPNTAELGKWTVTVVGGPGHNPKRGASYHRFALYHTAGAKPGTCTVEQALTAGVWRADLKWDLAHGLITLAPPAA